MGKILYGHVSNTEIPVNYEWVAEDGACEECMALDGKVYGSADEIPDKPHPNCKCHINVIENKGNNPLGELRVAVYEKQKIENDLNKMLGDVKSLNEEIDELINIANEQNFEIQKTNETVESIPSVVLQQFEHAENNIKKNIKEAKNTKIKAESLEKNIEKVLKNSEIKEVSKLQFELKLLSENVDNLGREVLDRGIQVGGAFLHQSDALWKLSYSKFTDGLDYVEQNGKVYESVDGLGDSKIKNFVKTKIQKQFQANDSRGVVFHSESELSKKINTSFALKKLIKNNKSQLIKNASIPDTSLNFGLMNLDLYNAIHRADIVDINIDDNGDFNAKVIDTYDFNPNSRNPLVRAAGHYQNADKIENYYVIVNIKIPAKEWQKY